MFFFFAAFLIASAGSAISIKTLVGYCDLKKIYKLLVAAVIVSGWFGPLILGGITHLNLISVSAYTFLYHLLFALSGFVVILFVCIMLRDIVWYAVYGIARLFKKHGWHIDPKNLSLLNKANIIVIAVAVMLSGYALYEGYKLPEIREVSFVSGKLNSNLKIAQISDLHINRATPLARLRDIVNMVNMASPDVIVLTGDTIGDNPVLIEEHLGVLRELSAPYGVFSIMGESEFDNDVYASKRVLNNNRLTFLFNGGQHIGPTNVFITGIPDLTTMFERVNLWRTLHGAEKTDYKVLLSHTPSIINSLSKDLVDLVLSGHTHGGQVFPFHILVKQANQYLAGKYNVNGTDLFVSRGAGNMGATMRLFAPSDIIMINLQKK